MRKIVLSRFFDSPDRTLGTFTIFEGARPIGQLFCLELPWKNNAREISRIPPGRYRVTPENTSRLGFVLRVHDVPGRSGILVHGGNKPADTRGCILAGLTLADIDGDSLVEASKSSAAMGLLSQLVVAEALLVVADNI